MSRIVDTIRSTGSEPEARPAPAGAGRKGNPDLGVVSYFHLNDHARVERVIDGLTQLGVKHLRSSVSWHDWVSEGGREWYDWLLPKLLDRFEVMPCVLYTPTHLGLMPKTSSPPRDPSDYGDFVDHLLAEYDGAFNHVELWNEPNNYIEWDWTVDPEWKIFAEMIAGAAAKAKARGVKAVLGGMSPLDPNWLHLMFNRGAMKDIDVLGIHGFPGTWEAVWAGWDQHVERVQEVFDHHGSDIDVWITECGFSTWQHDEFRMLTELVEVAEAPVTRVYWYCAEDLPPERATLDGFHADERAYHFGLFRIDGTPKLPARVWAESGFDEVRRFAEMAQRHPIAVNEKPATLITGGAGFVGTNLADRLASEGKPVVVVDNLSRPGVERNLTWLTEKHGSLVRAEIGDLRDRFVVRRGLERCDQVFHLAAQVAVTSSLVDPVHDFSVNLLGTLNLLEEMRRLDAPPPLLFTSTNKVYGNLEDVKLVERERRYEPEDAVIATRGIGESRPLDFQSPYGCSKGGADQYVLDYAKTFGLRTAVFRMSCIYGPHQFGTEDQGWVAHFLISAMRREPITIYGDGKQVRDILFVGDLVEAMMLAVEDDALLDGRAFNVGGGPQNTMSLLEILEAIEHIHGFKPNVVHSDWRVGDQRYYVSDTTSFEAATGWGPQVPAREGVAMLHRWLLEGARAQERVLEAETASR